MRYVKLLYSFATMPLLVCLVIVSAALVPLWLAIDLSRYCADMVADAIGRYLLWLERR